MAKSIGIDLGTTNSVCTVKKVRTEVLKNSEGEYITPSCVTFKKGGKAPVDMVVGRDALEWMKQDAENTIVAVKRLMGRNYSDREIKEILTENRLHYRVERHSRGTENSLAIILGGREFTPEEISSEILAKIKRDSEKALGDAVEYAVITVPSYFNDKQKHATRTAAALAGLKVRRLLPEPTAAAVSFGVDKIAADDVKTVLIFDFGGGTFDLSVLTISGGQFVEQGKGGDMWLGGEDMDRIIADYVLTETAGEHGIDDMAGFIEGQDDRARNRFIGELKEKVERAKIDLSREDEAYIEIPGVLKDDDGDEVDVDVELTRERFEKMIEPITRRVIQLTRETLEKVHFTNDLIDRVLLVGGSSGIPAIAGALKKEFGSEKVIKHDRPMLAISEGAALLSHRLAETYECPQCGEDANQGDLVCGKCGFDLDAYTIEHGVYDVIHAAAHDYYLHLSNNKKHLFVDKNTPLPVKKTEVFKLAHPEQSLVHMKFSNSVNGVEEIIGDLWLAIDGEILKGRDKELPLGVEITLEIDENNIADVTGRLKDYPEVRLSKTLSRGKADEKLFTDLLDIIEEANRKEYTGYVMEDLEHRSRSAIKDINVLVNEDTGAVEEGDFQRASLKVEKAGEMSRKGLSSRSTINYANAAMKDFGPAITAEDRDQIREAVARLEAMDEEGLLGDNIKAIDDLNEVLAKRLGAVNALMEIQKAGDFSMKNDPSGAANFYTAIKAVLDAFRAKDQDKARALLNESLPKAREVLKDYEARAALLHKDLRR